MVSIHTPVNDGVINAQAGDCVAIDCWVRAVILRLLEVAGPGPNPLMTTMWASGLHRAIVGPENRKERWAQAVGEARLRPIPRSSSNETNQEVPS